MSSNDYRNKIEAKRGIKRYLITMLCAVPFLIVAGVLLGENFNRGLRILIFVAIVAVVFVVEELIYNKIQRNKVVVTKEDVFK